MLYKNLNGFVIGFTLHIPFYEEDKLKKIAICSSRSSPATKYSQLLFYQRKMQHLCGLLKLV